MCFVSIGHDFCSCQTNITAGPGSRHEGFSISCAGTPEAGNSTGATSTSGRPHVDKYFNVRFSDSACPTVGQYSRPQYPV